MIMSKAADMTHEIHKTASIILLLAVRYKFSWLSTDVGSIQFFTRIGINREGSFEYIRSRDKNKGSASVRGIHWSHGRQLSLAYSILITSETCRRSANAVDK